MRAFPSLPQRSIEATIPLWEKRSYILLRCMSRAGGVCPLRNGYKGCVMPEPVAVFGLVLPVYVSAISGMRTPSAVGSGNSGSTTALATACTMPRVVQGRSSCSVVVIRPLKPQTSGRHRRIGPRTSRGGNMSRLTKSYRESLLQALQDPQEAAEYLTAALEEGD